MKLRIVELIGEHRARLSPAGRELWLSTEQLIETSQPGDDIVPALVESGQQWLNLSLEDRRICSVLGTLFMGLRASDLAQDRSGAVVANKFRRGTIIKAAHKRATAEGRTVPSEPDMTLDEALDLLAEPYSPNAGA
jgi:hypothetical protein